MDENQENKVVNEWDEQEDNEHTEVSSLDAMRLHHSIDTNGDSGDGHEVRAVEHSKVCEH